MRTNQTKLKQPEVLGLVMVMVLGLELLVLETKPMAVGLASQLGGSSRRIAPHDADKGPSHVGLEAQQV